MGDEQQFLRQSSRVMYEENDNYFDTVTGELQGRQQKQYARSSTEPDYIKLYYKAMMAVSEIKEIPLEFLLALSAQLGWASDDKVLFYNNKTTRRNIADYCRIGDNMVTKYIRRCVRAGILFITDDRGTYEVNPWLIAKGKWDSIKKLQASFEFVHGKWRRTVDREEQDEDGNTTTTSELTEGDLPTGSREDDA